MSALFWAPHSSPSDGIRALVCGYPHRYWAGKILVMLEAFIDDSSSESGDRRLFLAGYVGTATEWIKFADAWDRDLRANPSIDYFHMVEAQNLRGQFLGWSERARDRKVLNLAKIISSHDLWSIQCSVSRDDYIRIIRPVAPRGLGNPYFECFFATIVSLARFHHQQGITTPVDFVFDEQGGLGAEAVMMYEYVKGFQLPEVAAMLGSTPIFRDDRKVVPLQAADMLAWHVRRESERIDPPGRLNALDLLRADGRHLIVETTAADLESMAEKMRAVPGVSLTQEKGDWRRVKRAILALGGRPPPALASRKNFLKRALERLARLVRA